MKLKPKSYLNLTLLFCSGLFFLSCNGQSNQPEVTNLNNNDSSKEETINELSSDCPYKIYSQTHILTSNDYVDLAKTFINNTKVNNNGALMPFIISQSETINIQSLKSLINTYQCNHSTIPGIAIFLGLIREGNVYKIKHYLGMIDLEKHDNPDGQTGILKIPIDSLTINDFSGDLYQIVNSNLKKVNTAEFQVVKASCVKYVENIKFKNITDDNYRAFNTSNDASGDSRYIIYPLQIIEELSLAVTDPNSSIVISTGLKKIKTGQGDKYMHTINFGTDTPENASKLDPIKDKAKIDAFKSYSANFGQLCPTKCKEMTFKYIQVSPDGKKEVQIVN
ncbi:MAG: hypothetical protein WED33_02110 [Bacteroidia bacterium]